MGAIPTSALPGHKMLHERVYNALDRCQEAQGIDFKESAPWDNLKNRIVKTALAMGNLRDGGVIIVGASERGSSWDLTGISPEHLETYDVDTIIDTINKYCSPYVELDIVLVKYQNKQDFLAIQIREFIDTPLLCKKEGPDGLLEGAVYIRPPGVARSTRVMNASQMHDLLELAAEKRARRILEVSRRVGLVISETTENLFDKELGEL